MNHNKLIKINQIKLPIVHTEEDLARAIKKSLRCATVPEYRIVKQSIDARDQNQLQYIYSVELAFTKDLKKQEKKLLQNKNIILQDKEEYSFQKQVGNLGIISEDRRLLSAPPVIVGTGPAGMFCGYQLAKAGYQPILIERGLPVPERVEQIQTYWNGGSLNEACNVQFGEGGAGTFSDGKLNTMTHDKYGRIEEVLKTYTQYGADSKILYVNKPHIGTDQLRKVVVEMRNAILSMGGTILFDTCLVGFEYDRNDNNAFLTASSEIGEFPTVQNKGSLCSITIIRKGEQNVLPCSCLVLATGHSARDTFSMLYQQGVTMTAKPFAVGLRMEHPAEMINQSQYGCSKEADLLPAADYKLTHQTKEGRAVYSFCMCPGGHIVDASSEKEQIAVNGMSYHSRNAVNSNSAIVVNVTPEDFEKECGGSAVHNPLLGMEFQRKWEHAAYLAGQGKVPLQLFGDYAAGKKTTTLGAVTPDIKGQYSFSDLNDCLPKALNSAIIDGILSFDRKIHGFAREDAVLCGIESRTSSPVRIVRNERFQGNIEGIFPCGEGAGYAGGITSAAVDGIKVAEAVAAQYQPGY